MTSDIGAFSTPSIGGPPSSVPIDWSAVEDWLGLRLPTDYKRLADRYGPLDFGEYVWIHVPCVQRDRFDYGEWLRATHREARIEARELSEAERPVFHPEPGGLLAWGARGAATYSSGTPRSPPTPTGGPWWCNTRGRCQAVDCSGGTGTT